MEQSQFDTTKEGQLLTHLVNQVDEIKTAIFLKMQEYEAVLKTMQAEIDRLKDKESALCEMDDCTHIGETIGDDGKMRCADCHMIYLDNKEKLAEWQEALCPKCGQELDLKIALRFNVDTETDVTGFDMKSDDKLRDLDFNLDVYSVDSENDTCTLKCSTCNYSSSAERAVSDLPSVYTEAIRKAKETAHYALESAG
jgi:hypothetical protein